MGGLTFEDLAPAEAAAPNRADVACFVGFVARRPAGESTRVVPPADGSGIAADFPVYRWLDENGWARRPFEVGAGGTSFYGRGLAPTPPPWTRGDDELESLLDVPVLLDSWELFDRLFDWDARPLLTASTPEEAATIPRGTTYLGAAVRSFFAQGGRRCYVVRVGDPWPLDAGEALRQQGLRQLIPGLLGSMAATRVDRASWHGVGHLFGLPEVSFVCLPDLPDAVSSDRDFPKLPPEPPPPLETFVECSAPVPPAQADRFVRALPAPRCTLDGYATWAAAIREVASLLQDPRNGLREIQLVAAIPLPSRARGQEQADSDLLAFLIANGGLGALLEAGDPANDSFASAFVQLAWPWVKTLGSRQLPEEIEGPDAPLVGVLARNALARGSYRSAAGLDLAEVHDVYPGLRSEDRELSDQGDTLIRRVSLLGPTPGGMQVLSDVTTFPGESYRQGNVNRLVSAIVRAARRLGEDFTFAPSDPALWARLAGALDALLTQLWQDGALRGQAPDDAFEVRCDMSTMTERDLEQGRVLAEVTFEAAAAIDQLRVVLAMTDGTISLLRAA